MNRMILAGLATLALGTGGAMAQTCSVGPGNNLLTQAQLASLLGSRYACVGTSPTATWNELHSGGVSGTVTDYKKGPGDPVDPTKIVGTYTVTGTGTPQTPGTVTYSYSGGGGTYAFQVYGVTPPAPGVYSFCGSSNLLVTISPTHC